MKQKLLAFYGDDFTGSTDALEFLTRAGAKTLLFIEPPSLEQLAQFPNLDAYGIAGMTRALPALEMDAKLLPAFSLMKASKVRHVHYKTCSTFDSSPAIGSIGKAIDTGASVFANKLVPLLVAAPALGRYSVFGNLFARMGIGSNGSIFRLDRHPSMSKHPVTPMDESDLQLHLGKQTVKKIGLINLLQLDKPVEEMFESDNDEEIILLDCLYESQLLKIGTWIDQQVNGNAPLFSVGSSGIEMALGEYWKTTGKIESIVSWQHPGCVSPLLVISGSCSPVTLAQIVYARANGFEEVVLDPVKICRENIMAGNYTEQVNTLLRQDKNVVVHTGEKQAENLSSEKLGMALGLIAKQAVEKSLIKRVLISGGDTSSYAARAMQIDAVEMIAPLVTGAPLCKVISSNKMINGLEVNIKGGQVGAASYFELVRQGGMVNSE
ncbi:MAG: four-carbon acid sugar kinase family protein [Bacteroidota bacterium]